MELFRGSHFFIAYLPKGTYVFECSTRVQHRREYQTGLASIQCMDAPEFNSHSESLAWWSNEPVDAPSAPA